MMLRLASSVRGLGALLLAAALASCGGRAPANGAATASAPRYAMPPRPRARASTSGSTRATRRSSISARIDKTMLGRKDDYDKIDDVSEAAQDAQLAWRRETVAELQAHASTTRC